LKVNRLQLPWIASKSLKNCHVRGVDSVLFDDTSGARVRAFVANKDHDLWMNYGDNGPMSVAIHPHHCRVTLKRVFGNVHNVFKDHRFDDEMLKEYKYVSPILKGTGSFKETGMIKYCKRYIVPIENEADLPSWRMHSVYVPGNEEAAWFVYEGVEDTEYEPYCWSNADLTKFDFSGLYQPMDVEYLKGLLKKFNVEVVD